jgi:hypothetical protein
MCLASAFVRFDFAIFPSSNHPEQNGDSDDIWPFQSGLDFADALPVVAVALTTFKSCMGDFRFGFAKV